MTRRTRFQWAAGLSGMLSAILTVNAAADPSDPTIEVEALRQEILNLKHKVERLEKSRVPLNLQLEQAAEKESVGQTGETEAPKPEASWWNNFRLNGLAEVEASYADTPEGSESDLTVSTVELGLDAQVHPWVNAHILVLYEQDATDPPEIDEAIITIANGEQSPWSLALGRQYVSFGHYDSYMVSDPLTLEIGETRATAAQLGFMQGDFHALTFIYKGDTDDQVESVGINLGLIHETEASEEPGYTLELSWMNNLANSNSLRDFISHPGRLEKRTAGLGLAASASLGNWTLMGEYLGAISDFDSQDLAFDGRGARPQASNLEAAYHFHLFDKETFTALAWQHSREALALELPENRYLITLGMEIFTHTTLAVEYAHDVDYAQGDGGSGRSSDLFTLQLAASF
ncbi:LbtU family siderophore porin [Thiolapillus brandeum]|uniref:LbtU family siderophore porin n=1 Tax=Thiolapillus brandeum TaxID=1076588 RepID=A0A7U6GHK0_9GAMM|nr:LbtU family siderophore porin [Thiolapillus brandeum]BAO43758.1 conserved hypothetical protein [Thiolapillus brandeum]